jgi:hypothetical protein
MILRSFGAVSIGCQTSIGLTSDWLPDEEGTQLRFEFEAELARLEAA